MTRNVVVDTGPIVAFFSKADQYHNWAVEQFHGVKPPMFTCAAVLSEACFLLSGHRRAVDLLFQYLQEDVLRIEFDLSAEITAVGRLLRRYGDQPMSLADACLVRMSETLTNAVVMTMDQDFRIYRKDVRRVIPLITPP